MATLTHNLQHHYSEGRKASTTLRASVPSMIPLFRKWRFRLPLLWLNRCPRNALRCLTFPDAVTLKRRFIPLCVFCFGMTMSLQGNLIVCTDSAKFGRRTIPSRESGSPVGSTGSPEFEIGRWGNCPKSGNPVPRLERAELLPVCWDLSLSIKVADQE